MRLVNMDKEELVAIIEQPDGSMLDKTIRVARNGGGGRVRSNAKGSKSASSPDRAVKIQEAATGSYQVCAAERIKARSPIQDLHSS